MRTGGEENDAKMSCFGDVDAGLGTVASSLNVAIPDTVVAQEAVGSSLGPHLVEVDAGMELGVRGRTSTATVCMRVTGGVFSVTHAKLMHDNNVIHCLSRGIRLLNWHGQSFAGRRLLPLWRPWGMSRKVAADVGSLHLMLGEMTFR